VTVPPVIAVAIFARTQRLFALETLTGVKRVLADDVVTAEPRECQWTLSKASL
jgi:hypothetical protein